MRAVVRLVFVDNAGQPQAEHELLTLDREVKGLAEVGLSLEESKVLLRTLQQVLVAAQSTDYLRRHRDCPACGRPRLVKGYHPLIFRSLMGDIELRSPRWVVCGCQQRPEKSFSPLKQLLGAYLAPEYEYLQAKWAATLSFAAAADLLKDILPVGGHLNAETVRLRAYRVARRSEQALGPELYAYCEPDRAKIEASPEPEGPITVGLDGGYVRGRNAKPCSNGCFEVIAGKSIPRDRPAKYFALVRSVDERPKRRLYELLRSQGMTPRQRVSFLSDGGDSLKQLQQDLNPDAEHRMDWFHITMRITVMQQTARGLPRSTPAERKRLDVLAHHIESVKWYLWHGNVLFACEFARALEASMDRACQQPGAHPVPAKLQRLARELADYVEANAHLVPNYGELYRRGERISTGFVESAVNAVLAKRFAKKQQMRWTPQGVHLLVQLRCQMLNGDLQNTFRGWYPGFRTAANDEHHRLAA